MSSHFDSLCPMSVWSLPLRIQRRGSFFSDDLFSGSRNYFESAAQELLREFDTGKNEDSFRTYRNLRERQLSGTDRTTKVAEEDTMFKIVMDVQGFIDENLQVKIVGPNTIAVEGKQQTGNGSTFSKRSFTRRFSLPDSALLQEASSVLSSDNILTVNVPKRAKALTSQAQQCDENVQSTKTESKSTLSSTSTNQKESTFADDSLSTSLNKNIFHLPILQRDSFFQDSFFENVRQNFQKSVDDVMNRRLQRIRSIGDVGLFRKVRETNEEDTQALSVSEDDHQYKIALDVHGFNDKDLKITALSDTEIVVEGCTKNETTYTSSFSTFKKRFPLPAGANIQEAKTALSSEGILSILVPKNKQSICSVKSEASDLLSKVIKEEQSRHLTLASSSDVTQKERQQSVPVVMESQESVNQETRVTSQSIQSHVDSPICKKEHKVPIELEEQSTYSKDSSELLKQTSKQNQTSSFQSQITSQDVTESVKSTNRQSEVETNKSHMGQEYYVPIKTDAGISIKTLNEKDTHSTKTDFGRNKTDFTPQTVERQHYTTDSRTIPISFKGSLYSDSIFEDARRSFEIETQNALNRYKMSAVKDDMETGQIHDLSQQSTKIITKPASPTILDDDHYYKIILDVFGYEEKEIKIKIIGDEEITVEGSSERTKAGAVSRHSFQKTFTLPQFLDLDRASTALSSEGILTITIPKKNQVILKTEKVIPITSQIEKEIQKSKEVKTTLIVDQSGVVQDSKKEPKYPGLGSLLQESTTQKSLSETHHESRHEETVPSYDREISKAASVLSDDGSVTSADLTSRSTSVTTTKSDYQDICPEMRDTRTVATRDDSSIILPISPKGHFFDDSYFKDSRSLFESELRNTMNRFSRSTSFVDDLGYYQSLRQGKLSESGNQIATLNEDDKFVKIIVDAHGFNENNLVIKIGCGNEISIEGSYEGKSGNSCSRKSFKKSWTLPSYVDVTKATSALSSDGVLNIVIPKTTQKQIGI